MTALDRRGHGRTPDADGDYSYRQMTVDVIAALEALASEPVSLVGYSDGGRIALEVASRRPDLVRSVVSISGHRSPDGIDPGFRRRLENPDPMGEGIAPLRAAYGEVSPDGPEHWPVVHGKVSAMALDGPLGVHDVAAIAAPTLLVVADDDVVTAEHTLELFRAIPESQLAVVPGTSHLLGHERPELLATLVEEFLRRPRAERMLPITTAS